MQLPINWMNLLSSRGGGFCTEYQTVYDSFTTKPSATVANADNTMVNTIVSGGVWSKLDVFDVFAEESNGASESLKNWISPGTFDPTLVNTPSFVSLEGFTGNGSSSYINTNWNPFDDGIHYTLNSASGGVYIRTNTNIGFDLGGRTTTSTTFQLASRYSGNAYLGINLIAAGSVASADSRGMWIGSRVDSTDSDLYKNKVKIIDGSGTSAGLSAQDFYVLAFNAGGSASLFSDKQVSLAFFGAGLTQGDVDIITDAFETRMDKLGKGVIA